MAGMSESPTLRRALGRWDLTAIGVNQVIGSAIFLLPADVARLVGPWGPLAFIGVGLLSLSIALCFAEVGSRFEKTGGPYLPARAAFGRFIGFEVGWMMWFTRVTSQASVANGLALALAFYWPALATGAPRMSLIAALTIALTWINVRGIKQSSWVVNALTIGKLAPLAIVIIVGVWFIDPARFCGHAGGDAAAVVERADPADLRLRRLRGHRRAGRRGGQPARATCRSRLSPR